MLRLIALVLVATILSSFTACGDGNAPLSVNVSHSFADPDVAPDNPAVLGDVDVESIIASTVYDENNTIVMLIGDNRTIDAAFWTMSFITIGATYSHDVSVATISDSGVITAVGPGATHLLFTDDITGDIHSCRVVVIER